MQKVRTVFKYGVENDLIKKAIRYGSEFKKPGKRVMRQHLAKNGKHTFAANELRTLIDAAGVPYEIAGGLTDDDVLPLPVMNWDNKVADMGKEDYAKIERAKKHLRDMRVFDDDHEEEDEETRNMLLPPPSTMELIVNARREEQQALDRRRGKKTCRCALLLNVSRKMRASTPSTTHGSGSSERSPRAGCRRSPTLSLGRGNDARSAAVVSPMSRSALARPCRRLQASGRRR